MVKNASIDDAAPVQKQGFIKHYQQARRKAFRASNIQSGFRAAGIWPIDPSQPLASSLRQVTPPPAETAASTVTPGNIPSWLTAPQSERAVLLTIQGLRQQEQLSRDCRLALQKAGKTIGTLAAKQAQQEAEIQQLRASIEELRPRRAPRRAVNTPNDRFINIEDIRRSREEDAQDQARATLQPTREANQTRNPSREPLRYEGCLINFQV